MSEPKAWNGDVVRKWLESRFAASQVEQDRADRRGYEAQDDYDVAAAEGWVCGTLKGDDATNDQAAFAKRVKALLDQEEYRVAGIYDDRRFDRAVRSYLRKIAKMTKAKEDLKIPNGINDDAFGNCSGGV